MVHPVEKRAFNGAIYGFIQFILTFVQTILLVPLLLTGWGQEKYGIYIAVFAFIVLLRTIDFGHQSFVGNEFNKEYFLDRNKATLILASSIKMALILGGLEFLVFIILWISGAVYSLLGLEPHNSLPILIGVLSMVIMWWIVGSVSGIISKAVLCKGLYPETVLWAIGLKILEIILLLIAGIFNMSLFNLLWLWAIINVIYMMYMLRWAMRYLLDFKQIWKMGSWSRALISLKNSIVLTVNNLFDQFNGNGIIIIVTRFISLAAVPVFVTLRTITNTAIQFTTLIINPLQPELIRYHSEKTGHKIFSIIQVVWIISGIVVNVFLLALIPFIDWFYNFWTKGLLPFNLQLFILLCLSAALSNFGKSLIVYLSGINDLKAIALLSGSRFVITFGLSLILIGKYGLISIGIGLLIAELFSSVILPLYLTNSKLRFFNTQMKSFDIIWALLPIVILAICYIVILANYFSPLLVAILGIVCMIIVYITLWKRLQKEVQLRLKLLLFQLINYT